MAEKKFLDNNGLAHLWLLLKEKFSNKVDKVEGKGLSTNDLTDELLAKINNAGDSSFTGNYNDLTNKPDLTVYAEKTQVQTDINAAVSDKVTETQMNTAINNALANINKKEIVTSIAEMTDTNTIYLIANNGAENNIYDEYIVVNGTAEKIGTTDIDLTNYLKATDVTAITNSEIDEIIAS